MNIYDKLKESGITLPPAPPKGGVYSPAKEFGSKFIYVSGCGPAIGNTNFTGKLGSDLTLEQGQEAARNCILNVLAVIEAKIGDLNKIKSFVKMLTLVASENNFYQQPQVANAGSQLLVDIFGEEACPARSAIGVNVLPGNIAVETELLLELK